MKMKCSFMANEHFLALLGRLRWAAVLVLPVFGARAGVVLTTLHSFQQPPSGNSPEAGLVQGSDGSFYGTTFVGGTYGHGTVFKISTTGTLTTLHAFGSISNVSDTWLDGATLQTGLVQGNDGNFYGTTYEGGMNGGGTVFKISTNGALTSLYSFTRFQSNPSGLVQGSDGYLYGTTQYGDEFGNVFRVSTNGTLKTLYVFGSITNASGVALDGSYPSAALVQGSDGSFYGTTSAGGTTNYGTVFQIRPNGVLITLHSFIGGNDGAFPAAALVQGNDGNFYGTTPYNDYEAYGDVSGASGAGTVFKISTNGAMTTLYSFGSITNANGYALDGANPTTVLVQGSDGSFYGTTVNGGTNDGGTVFKISTNGALTSLYSFTSFQSNPSGLVQGSDASFYGTTQRGGTDNEGTVFRLTIVPDPQLSIIPSGPYVILTWPTDYNGFSYAGYTLQSTTNLVSPVWTTNSPGPVVIGGQNVVINTISGTQQFFRLSQ